MTCHAAGAHARRNLLDLEYALNVFMCTGVDEGGHALMTRQTSKAGDFVDLLALMEVLAVPNVCGTDVMKTRNFALDPLKLTVFAASDADFAQAPSTPVLASRRTPKDFAIPPSRRIGRYATTPPTPRNSPTRRSRRPICQSPSMPRK